MKAKKFFAVLLLLTGVLSVILSFSIADSYTGSYEPNITYGGDAYTGMQNASAQAANNIMALNSIISLGFQAVLLVGGLSLIFSSCMVLTGTKSKQQKIKSNQQKIKSKIEPESRQTSMPVYPNPAFLIYNNKGL